MDGLLQIDLRSIFVPSLHLAESTVVYLFLFIILRVLRREAGAVSIADLLVVVLIANAAERDAQRAQIDYEKCGGHWHDCSWDYFLDGL